MSDINDDLDSMIKEKIKTAKATNETFRGAAGRALRNGNAETMTVYRDNKNKIKRAEEKYLSNSENNDSAVNE